ncbi:hypothetical protein PPL_08720 [Heterostelium album PN500]|uniref:Serine-threonine/tyrosine-protein kinase catalytic domain-containing protein n=1 Tax=Heterostelium pallidum (strain ATCC 26659 / Pp 5 / PN500) TaxID=670386 RepID=D3BJJ3_HETP5|nr:hypothetical protein PPL_08720 [Heterostelium album PN500]EFA78073.1 hypothetical protein PPL_08720 [Heterostelium album PN500]|eukprot:XP_020430200.1 hypothetical protein PPL_08720 [Heterostelium album PN500]
MHNLGHTGISRTAGYNAPEHGSHGNYNELVDIFSFGVMMFEIITGEYFLNYFGNPNFHWSDIDMHASVKKLNESMTNTTPEKRPQSMTEIKVSLERILQDYRTQKWEMKDYSNLHTKKK